MASLLDHVKEQEAIQDDVKIEKKKNYGLKMILAVRLFIKD